MDKSKLPFSDELHWVSVLNELPKTENYYAVRFDNGIEDEKPFRIRPSRNIIGFMTEDTVTHWAEQVRSVLTCNGKKYTSNFKDGDRVEVDYYCGVLVLDGIDEHLTRALNKLHWHTVSERYLQGKTRTNNGEPVSDDEIRLV